MAAERVKVNLGFKGDPAGRLAGGESEAFCSSLQFLGLASRPSVEKIRETLFVLGI